MTTTEAPTYRRIGVAPATRTIGAFIEGVDLATIDDPTWAELEQAFAARVFPCPQEQRAYSLLSFLAAGFPWL